MAVVRSEGYSGLWVYFVGPKFCPCSCKKNIFSKRHSPVPSSAMHTKWLLRTKKLKAFLGFQNENLAGQSKSLMAGTE